MGAKRVTKEEFLRRAHITHAEKYDYSCVEYVDFQQKIKIICPKHGAWMQRPNDHCKGKGCSFCGKEKVGASNRLDKEEFLRRVSVLHGDRYDYSETVYLGYHKKISIHCEDHGFFTMLASTHLEGIGCQKCSVEDKRWERSEKKTSEFVQQARKIHGDKYDYSEAVYMTNTTPMKIECSLHGKFEASKVSHIKATGGCPGCLEDANARNAASRNHNKEIFVERSRQVHGDKYSYEKFVYKTSETLSTITCPVHGDWRQKPNNHLQGKGCKRCASEAYGEYKMLTQDEVIARCRDTHGDRFDYTKTIYKGDSEKIEVICRKHGSFWQKAYSHYKTGSICPQCSKEERGDSTEHWPHILYHTPGMKSNIYILKIHNSRSKESYIKVGLSVNVKSRKHHIKRASGATSVTILFQLNYEAMKLLECEQQVLKQFFDYKHKPSVEFGGQEECLQKECLTQVIGHITNYVKQDTKESQNDHSSAA